MGRGPGARVLFLALSASLLAPAVQASDAADWLNRARGLLQAVPGSAAAGNPGNETLVRGLDEALRFATDRAVTRLGRPDGFNADARVRIPLPAGVRSLRDQLARFGLSGRLDDLEVRLNRAAERAAPEAADLFIQAIAALRYDDARRILNGPDDAATSYFRRQMTAPLQQRFRPIIDRELAEAGAVQLYDSLTREIAALPFLPDVKGDLVDHALAGALEGLFDTLAREETAIRRDPAKRTTALLREVFGR